MEKISRQKKLIAFKHYDFWHCVETLKDKENLERMMKKKKI